MTRIDQFTHAELCGGFGFVLLIIAAGVKLAGWDDLAATVCAYAVGAHLASLALRVWEWWLDRYGLDGCDDPECERHEDDHEAGREAWSGPSCTAPPELAPCSSSPLSTSACSGS